MNHRQTNIDLLRGLAILMIVIFHAWVAVGRPSTLPLQISSPLFYFSSIGFSGVHIFIILSGYCLYQRHKELTHFSEIIQFYKSRFWKLSPPYYWAIAIYIFLGIYRLWRKDHAWGLPFSAEDIVAHLAYVHNLIPPFRDSMNTAFWFMGVIMQLVIIFPFILLLARRLGIGFALGLLFIVSVLYRYFIHDSSTDPIARLPDFMMGIAIAAMIQKKFLDVPLRLHSISFVLATALVGLATAIAGSKPLFIDLSFVLAYGILLKGIIGKAIQPNLVSRFFTSLGTRSYSIYLFHAIGIDLSLGLIKRLSSTDHFHFFLSFYILVLSTMGILAGLLFYSLFEKRWTSFYANYRAHSLQQSRLLSTHL